MMKFGLKLLSIATVFAAVFRFRYKLLNGVLAIPFFRKFSVNTLMNIPGMRSRMIGSVFSKETQ